MLKSARLLAVILVLAVLTPRAAAERIAVSEPGSLGSLLSDAATVTSLSLEGDIDARDLRFIAETMTSLRSLDLTAARIAACGDNPAGYIPSCTFAGSSLTEVCFPPDSPTAIGDMAFMGSSLTSLTLPGSLTAVGVGAFAGCPMLKSVTLSGSADLGSHVFADCPSLSSLTLNSVVNLPEAAFSGCSSLSSIEGGELLRDIGAKAFAGCGALDSFEFGKDLIHIGDAAFSGTALSSADMSKCTSLCEISPWALAHCTTLQSVILPPSLQTISEGMLFDASGMVALSLPASLSEVADVALSEAASLDSLSLPSQLTSIGSLAMNRLAALSAIDARQLTTVPALGADVWSGVDCPTVRLIVDPGMADDFASALQWSDFEIVSTKSTSAVPPLTTGSHLSWRVDGGRLIISATSALKTVRIFDAAGRLLAVASPQSTEYYYDKPSGATVLLVETTTADGSVSSDKILIN